MRTKKVNRFYCDHCNKGSLKKASMVRHERSCIKNSARVCFLCSEERIVSKPMTELMPVAEAGDLDQLRELTNGCPACMLAAIVQNRASENLPEEEAISWFADFDYKQELQKFREIHNVRMSDLLY